MCSILDVSCRVSCPTLIWWYILCNNASCPNYSTFSNCNSIAYYSITTDEHIIFYDNLAQTIHSSLLCRVEEMCKYSGVLCYCNAFAYGYKMWSNTVEIDIAVYPARTFNIYPPILTNLNLWCPRNGNVLANHMKNICDILLNDNPLKSLDILYSLIYLNVHFFINLLSSIASNDFFFASYESPFVPTLYFLLRSMYSSTVHTYFAGLPATTTPAGTDLVTMLPAATNAPSPIVTPGIICE